MKKLSILLSTINDRIYAAEQILLHRFVDTEFIIIHQITNNFSPSSYQSFYEKFNSQPIHFIQQFEKGTGKSRNAAMKNASGELFYLCDDDLLFKPDFYTQIIQTASHFPETDIFTFKIESTQGESFKKYPENSYIHTLRSTATVSIVEIVIRKTVYEKGWIHFDERFGLATIYNTGEEFIMMADALKNGAVARFIPEYIVQHPPMSSGKIWNKETAIAKGAMIARVYGWKFIIINGIFAIRKYQEYRSAINLLSFIGNIYKGSVKFMTND